MSPKMLNILLILIPVFLYYGVFVPLYNGGTGIFWTPEYTIGALQSQNVSYANALNQVNSVVSGIKKINDDYVAIPQETKDKITVMLPDSLDKVKLRNEVDAIANKAGVALGSVAVADDPASLRANKDIGAYIVSFTVRSRYPAFKNLMEQYEKNLRFYNINTISIKRPTDGGVGQPGVFSDKEALAILVSFRVYYLK